MLEILVLGTTRVRHGDVDVAVRSPKQRLLVASLALAGGEALSEDALVDELWPSPPADPVHALQAHVSRVRQATQLPVVHASGGYLLDGPVRVDAVEFEELVRRADSEPADRAAETLRTAIEIWRGPPLQDLPDTVGTHAHRLRLDLARQQAEAALVEALLASGQPHTTLVPLQEALAQDPLDEQRWGQLMRALAMTGQRAEALATYARARAHLVDGLGLDPSTHLQQIHREILDGDSRPVPAEVVGRDREWRALEQLRREAGARQQVALISGQPGIGKTFLASHFARSLPGTPTHFARAHRDRVAPYDVLAQLIRSEARTGLEDRLGPAAGALHALVPDLVAPGAAPAADPQVERHRIIDALVQWLRAASADGPLGLVIDDLQWADPDSLTLLADLWSHPRSVPVLWLVTVRDDEHAPGSTAAASLTEATRPSETLTSVVLRGMDRDAVARLLGRQLAPDEQPHARTVDDVVAATAGNPLLVTETARLLHDRSGAESGALSWDTVPQGLSSIIDGYLQRLEPSHRALLDVAAVIGEDFDPLLLSLTGTHDTEEVDDFLSSAQRLGLLVGVEDRGLRQRFRHSLVHAVVLQQVPPLRRARLDLAIARAFEQSPSAPDRLHALAHHYLQAVSLTGPEEAVEHVLTAADASQRHGAPGVALDLYRQAEQHVDADSPYEQRVRVHLGLGEAGFRAGEDYRDHLLLAARLADEAGDLDLLVRAAVANHRGWYSSVTEVDRDRIAVIEAALARVPVEHQGPHAPARSRLLSLWAMENVRDPARRDEVLARSEESIRIAEGLDDASLLGEIMCHRFSVLYATFVDPVGTLDFARRLDDLARSRVDPELQLNSAIAVAQSAMMVGDFATADVALDRSEQLATDLAHPPRMWLVGTWRATRTAMSGDLDGAMAQAAAAHEMGVRFEQPDAETWFMGQLFAYHHVMGRLLDLIDVIEEQVGELDGQIPAWRSGYALTLALAGRWSEARRIIDDFTADPSALPLDVLHLHGLAYLAEAVVLMQYAAAAPALYVCLRPHQGLVANNATIDAGPVDLRLAGLAALLGDDAAAQRYLDSAEAFCLRTGAPIWLEHVVKARASLR